VLAIPRGNRCLGTEEIANLFEPTSDAATAVAMLTGAVGEAARAIAASTDAQLDEVADSPFGPAPRRQWISTYIVEGIHHVAEIGVVRDLYRLSAA
jgi:hypothetical protein